MQRDVALQQVLVLRRQVRLIEVWHARHRQVSLSSEQDRFGLNHGNPTIHVSAEA